MKSRQRGKRESPKSRETETLVQAKEAVLEKICQQLLLWDAEEAGASREMGIMAQTGANQLGK